MHEFDPLQLNGWFVMTEKYVAKLPNLVFSSELFEFSDLYLKNQD